MNHKFPIFRQSGNGSEIYCVVSEEKALLIRKTNSYNGVLAVSNKITIDDVINVYEDDDGGNQGCFHTITQEDYFKEFEATTKKIDEIADLMKEVIK